MTFFICPRNYNPQYMLFTLLQQGKDLSWKEDLAVRMPDPREMLYARTPDEFRERVFDHIHFHLCKKFDRHPAEIKLVQVDKL